MGPAADITGLLAAVSNGEEAARTRLIEAVCDELRRLARGYFRRERPDFGGLTVEQTAAVLGVAPITVKRDRAPARAWLSREVRGRPG